MAEFRQRLRELRGETTQSVVAVAISKSVQSYSAFENGREPDYETLMKIADYFNVTLDYLLGRSNYKHYKFQAIGEELGLNNSAIESLIRTIDTSEDYKNATNALLSDRMFVELIEFLHWYAVSDGGIDEAVEEMLQHKNPYLSKLMHKKGSFFYWQEGAKRILIEIATSYRLSMWANAEKYEEIRDYYEE